MKIKYIGSQPLAINRYGLIKQGDVITQEDLCQSLASRQDFVVIKEATVGVTPTITKSKFRSKKKEK